MSDDMTPKQMRDKIDQLKEEAKAEAAHHKLELEMEKLRVINVQQELTITQMNSVKEIAGLKAKLESGPSSSGISEPPLKRPRTDGSDGQSGGDMKKTLERLVQKIDEMAKNIDGELQQLKKQLHQHELRLKQISSSCSSSMHTTPAPTGDRIEEVKSAMEMDQGSETGNNDAN